LERRQARRTTTLAVARRALEHRDALVARWTARGEAVARRAHHVARTAGAAACDALVVARLVVPLRRQRAERRLLQRCQLRLQILVLRGQLAIALLERTEGPLPLRFAVVACRRLRHRRRPVVVPADGRPWPRR
jgi:hypothetical protein